MNNKEGRNLEEINKKKILNFGDLSRSQSAIGIKVDWNQARIKCRRCNSLITAKWEDGAWNIGDWKVYLYKSQVEKNKTGYQITGGIEFYCPDCDWRHNYWEK